MHARILTCAFAALLGLTACDAGGGGSGAENAPADGAGLDLEIAYRTLDNGLKVVVAPIHSAPLVAVGVYYNVGFRLEPMGRTGFAHLFEHLMFTGSRHLPRGEFDRLIEGSGGLNNGSTAFDVTSYYEAVPSSALEAVLWAEADRMAFPDITEETLTQQKGVVANEVKVNVLNQPYGGFPWLDMPQVANQNWYNAHNFYGELEEIESATLEEAADFHARYYSPANAVLVVAGDADPDQVFDWAAQYFGPIPSLPAPALPDISEPRQEVEKTETRTDPLAPQPALAFAYHVPERGTDEWYAFALIHEMMAGGDDSRLYRALVQDGGYASEIFGGINMMGPLFAYQGPMLWTVALIHDDAGQRSAIMNDASAQIEALRTAPVDPAELERARTKLLSGLYDTLDDATRISITELLAAFAMFDDDPQRIHELEARFAAVTPDLVQQVAQDYLRPTNRTVLYIDAGAAQ